MKTKFINWLGKSRNRALLLMVPCIFIFGSIPLIIISLQLPALLAYLIGLFLMIAWAALLSWSDFERDKIKEVKFCLASRGIGSVDKDGVIKDYKLLSFDLVDVINRAVKDIVEEYKYNLERSNPKKMEKLIVEDVEIKKAEDNRRFNDIVEEHKFYMKKMEERFIEVDGITFKIIATFDNQFRLFPQTKIEDSRKKEFIVKCLDALNEKMHSIFAWNSKYEGDFVYYVDAKILLLKF